MPSNAHSSRRRVAATTSSGSPAPRLFPRSTNAFAGHQPGIRSQTPASRNDDPFLKSPPSRTPLDDPQADLASRVAAQLQNAPADVLNSLLLILGAPGRLEPLVQDARTHPANSPHHPSPAQSTSTYHSALSHQLTGTSSSSSSAPSYSSRSAPSYHSRSTPSYSSQPLFPMNTLTHAHGASGTSTRSETLPSYSTIHSPELMATNSRQRYNLRPRPPVHVDFRPSRFASHHPDLSEESDSDCTSGSSRLVPRTGPRVTRRTCDVPSSNAFSGPTALVIVCSGITTKGVRCTIRPAAAKVRLLRGDEDWFCHHHISSASGSSQGVCSGTKSRGGPCSKRPSAAKLQELLRDRVKVWYCNYHIPAVSSSPQPIASANPRARCAGMTRDRPCRNSGEASPHWPWLEDKEELPCFCPEHEDALLEATGFRSAQTGEWIEYDDWIVDDPNHVVKALSDKTRALLRERMNMGPSASDREGYIYCYELLQAEDPNYVHLKVGRSENFVKRIHEWRAQCGTKNVLKGWFPGMPNGAGMSELAVGKALVERGEALKGKHCYMLERLIHLQLKDVAADYELEPCECETNHREIFTFDVRGIDEEDPWEYVVRPIIERWYRFVNENT